MPSSRPAWASQKTERVEIAPEGGQDHDIAGGEGTVDGDAVAAEAAYRLAVGAEDAGAEGRLETEALLLAVAQAGHVEEVLGLHQGRGEDAVDGDDADMFQHRSGLSAHGFLSLL